MTRPLALDRRVSGSYHLRIWVDTPYRTVTPHCTTLLSILATGVALIDWPTQDLSALVSFRIGAIDDDFTAIDRFRRDHN